MKHNRSGAGFARDNSIKNDREPDWFAEFANRLEKNSVNSHETDQALYNQIGDILGSPKSKFSTVEDAVRDMHTRTGLDKFLNAEKSLCSRAESKNEPEAMQNAEMMNGIRAILQKVNGLDLWLRNFIQSRKGSIDTAAVLNDIPHSFLRAGLSTADLDSDNLKKYVDILISDEKKQHASQQQTHPDFGKVDISNTEDNQGIFEFLTPAKTT